MARLINRMLIGVLAGLPVLAVAQDWAGFEPMDMGQLEAASGRQGIPIQWQLNETEQNAMVSDNVLSGNVLTGDNRISDQAFQNMSGVATVIQNTGNQVVIQDSTQINILLNQ
jgi:hypothetical protein